MSRTTLLLNRTSLASPITSRLMIEPLEERQFFSAAPAAVAGVDVPLKTQSPIFADKIAKKGVSTILPMNVTGVQVVDGALVAVGKIGNTLFDIPLTLTTASQEAGLATQAVTDILHLQLGPIHLDLLGLKVDTSKICLEIDAVSGPGNLLGNLLTSVANLLNGGTPLGSILGGLSGGQLNQLLWNHRSAQRCLRRDPLAEQRHRHRQLGRFGRRSG